MLIYRIIGGAASIKGEIFYYTDNVNKLTLNTTHKETYDDALKDVQMENAK